MSTPRSSSGRKAATSSMRRAGRSSISRRDRCARRSGHNHPNIVAAIRKSCDTALHLFSGMIPRSVVQLADALAKIVPEAAPEVADAQHRQREQRRGDQDGQALHRRLRGRRTWRVVARRHRQRGVGFLCQRPQGLRSGDAGNLRAAGAQCVSLPGEALPRPLRPHLHEDRLRALRHAVDGRARSRHRRAGHQRGRRHRAAAPAISTRCRRKRRSAACC